MSLAFTGQYKLGDKLGQSKADAIFNLTYLFKLAHSCPCHGTSGFRELDQLPLSCQLLKDIFLDKYVSPRLLLPLFPASANSRFGTWDQDYSSLLQAAQVR